MRNAALCLVLAVAAPAVARSQPVPALRVGERLTYDVRYIGPFSMGRGALDVLGIDTVRGREAYHVQFTIDGGIAWYHVHDRYESWIDRERFVTLRYWQDMTQGSRHRVHHYEIFPERGVYVDSGKPERPTVASPLDEASIIYLVRSMPLDSGARYDIPRYFIPDRNPVTVIVRRREKITVGAGTFPAVVVQPLIKTSGVFAEGGRAEFWFSDDEQRYLLRLTAHLNFGTITLALRSIEFMTDGR